MTMNSPANSLKADGARYAGSENSRTATAGLEAITPSASTAAASAMSAAKGLDSMRAHKRLAALDTAQTYR